MVADLLDHDTEVQVPEVVGARHEVDRQYNESSRSDPSCNIRQETPPHRRRNVFDNTHRVGPVKRRCLRNQVECAVPRAMCHSDFAVIEEVPLVPVRLGGPSTDSWRRVHRLDDVPHTREEGGQWCYSGADVYESASWREAVADELGYHRVLP